MFPKISRYENERFTMTEKIDGTNACIIFDECGEMSVQSRKRLITPDDDNYGFARWAYGNAAELHEVLGEGRHFGEFWGLGIQRGYGQKVKRFSLFNSARWAELNETIGGFLVDAVPVIVEGTMSMLDDAIAEAHHHLLTEGSYAAPGFTNPEGVMVYLHQLRSYLKAPLKPGPKLEAA